MLGFFPTSRFTISPVLGFGGRFSGTGTILGGFGNDVAGAAVLSGKVNDNTLTLVLSDAALHRKLSFKGTRSGAGFVGKLTHKIPPASGAVAGFTVPDVF